MGDRIAADFEYCVRAAGDDSRAFARIAGSSACYTMLFQLRKTPEVSPRALLADLPAKSIHKMLTAIDKAPPLS
eukprot:NODE_5197_length_320_cov_379.974170_g4586_i0.p2 GENE.NODE_5197_length_320_cov_379.974170_g4586_i0~~NODE_5197_length_320_cov_379.974170_g4586_i0.p2  ORF type:complete len:74 (+),score=15.71 NODE_5197_length_320_cov_379.974170_g4586_i0:29-250(+)